MRELLIVSERNRELQHLAKHRTQENRGPLRSSVNRNIATALVAIWFHSSRAVFRKEATAMNPRSDASTDCHQAHVISAILLLLSELQEGIDE